jgi:hypothetical protein
MTGTNFSSWYRTDEGTLYCEAAQISASGNQNICQFGVNNNSVGFVQSNTSFISRVDTRNIGGTLADYSTSIIQSGVYFKAALGMKANSSSASVNGGTATTINNGNFVPTVSVLTLGTFSGLGNQNSYIKKIAYYPKRLTNQELVGLTTV